MRADLVEKLPLLCPRCRVRTAEGWDTHTVSVRRIFAREGDAILDGELGCDNRRCHAHYPILDGIPIVVADVAAVLSGQAAALHAGRQPEALAALAAHGPDETPLAKLLAHLSTYLDAHWGDRSLPPPDVPAAVDHWGFHGLAGRLASLPARSHRTVELGCSVGRGLFELARHADLTVGVDLHLGALRAARLVLGGHALRYARRRSGRHYGIAEVPPGAARANVALVCGDALDPPLAPGHFDRAVALNLLDSVRSPSQLLSVADALLATSGELILSSPWSWQSDVVEEAERPPDDEPGRWLRKILETGERLEASYQVLDDAEVTWTLRSDERSVHLYRADYLRARKSRPVQAASP